MEQEADRLRLDLEWAAVAASPDLVVIDEAQAAPEIFPRLRGAIDAERRRNGRFLLLGSISPALMRDVSESLAGRLAVVELAPLSFRELPPDARRRLWRCGGYPTAACWTGMGSRSGNATTSACLPNGTCLHGAFRPAPIPPDDSSGFSLLATGNSGMPARSAGCSGLSYHTVNAYLEYLEGAFLIRRLPAYSTNPQAVHQTTQGVLAGQRLLHSLIGMSAGDNIATLPMAGASWEGHVIDQIVTALTQTGRDFDAWHLRTTSGREIDLVLRVEREIWAVGIKLTTNPTRAIMTRLNRTADMIGADRRYVVTRRPGSFGNSVSVASDLDGIIATAVRRPARATEGELPVPGARRRGTS